MTTESLICLAVVGGLLLAGCLFLKYSPDDFEKVPLTVIIEKTSTGYSAYCKEMEGIIAVEDNIPALKDQFHEAFLIMLNYQCEIHGPFEGMYPSDFEITYIEE